MKLARAIVISRIKSLSLSNVIVLFVTLSCNDQPKDPIPIITFQNGNTLICNLGSSCYNPILTSIRVGQALPDGTFYLYSGRISVSSSDPTIAEQDNSSNGGLIIKKTGECIVTAIQQAAPGYNSEGRASFKLTVLPKLDELPKVKWYQEQFYDMSQPFFRGIGDSIINPLISSIPQGGGISYSSSNSSIVSVNPSGLSKCYSVGQATITAQQAEKPGVNRSSTLTYRVVVDPRPTISFSEGSPYTCTLWTNDKYQNKWISSIPDGGPINTIIFDGNYANVKYNGEIIDIIKAGKTIVQVVQDAKYGVNARAVGSYELIILPPKPLVEFSEGFTYKCSIVSGGCKNEARINGYYYNDYPSYMNYQSSDASIASVNKMGEITPSKSGVVTVKAILSEIPGAYQQSSGTYTLTIIDYPIPQLGWSGCVGQCNISCKLNDPSIICEVTARTNVPQGSVINYSSSDPSIATIHIITGKITPIKIGKTIITAFQPELPGVNGYAKIEMGLFIY